MFALLSILVAFFPILVFVTYIRWLDKYDREPWSQIALVFLLGATFSAFFSYLENSFLALVGDLLFTLEGNQFLISSYIAPIIEETNKGLIILAFAWLSHDFDNVTDGLIYGVVVGLGFAFTENILYFTRTYEDAGQFAWLHTVYIRTFFTVGVHASASAIFGATVGYIRHAHPTQFFIISIMGWCVAVMIHSFWNSMLTASDLSQDPVLSLLPHIALPFIFFGLFMFMQFLLARERTIIADELADEAIIPEEHRPYLASPKRRERQADWLPPAIPRRAYLSLTARLAFAKDNIRHAHEKSKPYYARKIVDLRRQIQGLLIPHE